VFQGRLFAGPSGPAFRRPGAIFSDLFLRLMMGKSHSSDKRPPQGRLRGWHEVRQAKNEFR